MARDVRSHATLPTTPGEALLRKLSLRSTLTPQERAVVASLPVGEARVASREYFAREGEVLSRACMLLDGFAARYKLLPDGARQIVSLHVSGDIIDLHSVILNVADHSAAALGPARVAYLPHKAMMDAMEAHPGIARAFWYEAMVDGAIAREWLLNIGRRDAYGRLAHLFCEMALRMEAVGLCHDGRFQFMVTQSELADATAMTPVHINRTLHKMREAGLITITGSEVRIENWNALSRAGSFDPMYLYLPKTRR
jgi:CRP-like cAMP-binding protein